MLVEIFIITAAIKFESQILEPLSQWPTFNDYIVWILQIKLMLIQSLTTNWYISGEIVRNNKLLEIDDLHTIKNLENPGFEMNIRKFSR